MTIPKFEPVAEVLWYDPALRHTPEPAGKIIDGSMSFIESAAIGTQLYTADQLSAAYEAGKLEQAAQIESLRQQLAAAIAACELKDESLEAAHNGLRWWMDAFPLHVTEADNEEMLKIVKALAIQPGTEALEKWLGEPVAIIGKHGHPKHISAIPSIEENRLYGPFEPLYAKPKGLK
jgi:hypothetical protein